MDGGDGENFKRGRHERINIRVGVERRRKWSREDRLRIVQESLTKGTIIADLARRNEVSPSLIYEWRKQALAGLLDGFHQVRVVPDTGSRQAARGAKSGAGTASGQSRCASMTRPSRCRDFRASRTIPLSATAATGRASVRAEVRPGAGRFSIPRAAARLI